MITKVQLRKKFFKLRKKNYFEVKTNFFNPIFSIIKKKYKKELVYLSIYYPSNFELNTLNIYKHLSLKKIQILLPVVSKKNMKFYKWQYREPLNVNTFGMLEPKKDKNYIVPNIMLVPLLAFNKNKHRLGYGGGYYDNYLKKYLKKNKSILTIGVAFSFQKYDNLPVTKKDVSLNYIITEKGLA